MKSDANIILVGFMGTGKTAVGKRVAERLSRPFIDMDERIAEREGMSVAEIFSRKGEPHFRARERALVRELSSGSGCVIAAGGGIVLDGENIRDFTRSGLVVCLWASPEVILQRIAVDSSRPLLAGDDKLRRIQTLLETRRPLYEAIPCRMDTTGSNIEATVESVLRLYREHAPDCP